MSDIKELADPMPDGIHTHFDYRPEPMRLSPNGAKKLLPPSTPSKFDEYRRNPPGPKRVWDFGSVAHTMVLGEGDRFLVLDPDVHGLKKDGTVAAEPRATAAWKTAELDARAEGLIPIHVDDYRKAVEMAQKIHEHEDAGPLLADGDAEAWMYWTDPGTGQGLRQRVDWMTRRDRLTIVEYKTAADASQDVFPRRAFKFGYHIAAAFSVMGVKALGLEEDPDYVIVAQEKERPYDACVHRFDDDALRYGCQQVREAIAVFRRCMESGSWPGYPSGINSIPLPVWLIDDEMEIA